MKTKLKIILTAVNLIAVAAMTASAADLIRLTPAPTGNKMRIEGDSSIHKWQMECTIIGGYVEVGPGFPLKAGAEVKPGKVDAKVTVFIPVNQFKSIEEDGKPYSDSMDKRMYEAMKETNFPKVTYSLTELTLKEAPKTADAPYTFESKGELCIAGVTNKVTMPVSVTILGENKAKFAGSLTAKMTDYKLEPPALTVAGVGITTKDEVKLYFEWTVRKKTAPAAK